MSNSVVKVTDIGDDMLNDSLLLLVGEDGTVTPDQQTVETFLNSKTGPTNIQIMHIDKSDSKGIDVVVDNVTYLPDAENSDHVKIGNKTDMDEVARNLYNFKLDHDYTPLSKSDQSSHSGEDVDELAKTLSILHGSEETTKIQEAPIVITVSPQKSLASAATQNDKLSKPVTGTKLSADISRDEVIGSSIIGVSNTDTPKQKPKVIHVQSKSGTKTTPTRKKIKEKTEDNESESEFESDGDFEAEMDDDENDSDFDIDEAIKGKSKSLRTRTRSESKLPKVLKTTPRKGKVKKDVSETPTKQETLPNTEALVSEKTVEKALETAESKTEQQETKMEKKLPKKEKKTPKPIPDDFALFSTPDIIRRVGGKDPMTPVTPEAVVPPKPAKIMLEQRSKSVSDTGQQSPTKSTRNSVDGKTGSVEKHHRTSTENRRRSSIDIKSKRTSVDEKSPRSDLIKSPPKQKSLSESSRIDSTPKPVSNAVSLQDTQPKGFTSNSVGVADINNSESTSMETPLSLDATGLDIDQSILDNINNDMISEDILYQVAQQLVSNTELQNAIEKGINDGVLDTSSIQEAMQIQDAVPESPSMEATNDVIKEATQIVRPDGRIVVIPPIERPATRSRNKKKDDNKTPFKRPIKNYNRNNMRPVHKPLDEEHVSGNELDSSNEEEESEDDPNKLWCICNQPHNNRFMICCDTCEEWYHGKCVNITKAMGQQMESEGKEWICLFCKDPSLKRPSAAARRVRKASRNSRASTDSNSSLKKVEAVTSSSVPCVVCQKPARKSSIYCSETCILAHAQGIERVVVFERSTGIMLTGNKAPSAANLDQWLKEHPGYEVVRSAGKVVTTKSGNFTQSKLKLVKNSDNNGVSLAVQQKGISLGVLKHAPKQSPQPPLNKTSVKVVKIIGKPGESKETKPKLIQPQPVPAVRPSSAVTTPVKSKIMVQSTLTVKTPKPKEKEKPKEKVEPKKTPKLRQQEIQSPLAPHPKEENIRENVQKTVYEQLLVRLKAVDDIKLADEEVKNISADIETQLYKCFGDTGQKYRNKYRSLIFNIKDPKNQTLWRRICEKSISPYELVRLSPDDMASQELALWREQEAKHQLDMIKKSELELLNCNRQYVLKTHKGEQIVEDGRQDKIDNEEVIKSLTEGSVLDSGEKDGNDSSKEKDKKSSSKHNHKERDRKSSKDKDKDKRPHRSSSRGMDRSRRRSKSRDHRHGDKKRDKRSSRSRDRDRHRKSSHKSSRHKERSREESISSTDKLDKKSKEILEQLVDNKIVPPLEDRLWKHVSQEDIVQATANADSDSDHEPSSTVTIPTPPRSQESDDCQQSQSSTDSKTSGRKQKDTDVPDRSTPPPAPPKDNVPEVLWKGTINMIDVAQILITAHEVSGDCVGLGKELPENLDIVGRISPDTVWDYIGKMRCSNSKIISLVRLHATNVEEKMPYLALYSYLSSRNRLGVVKSVNKAVKDFYILPLAPQKPIPQALLPINGPGFEELRPALLLGIIVRDKKRRPMLDTISTSSGAPPKKLKVDVAIIQPAVATAAPSRSYTPPPATAPTVVKTDPRLKLPMPPVVPTEDIDAGDEPYSPEDSDPDISIMETSSVQTNPFTPAIASKVSLETSTYSEIPGIGDTTLLPSSKLDLQRQMEELNKKIEMQKSEITSITKNIATASGSEIGTSALASIALPSNLQQILDSIKSIGVVGGTEPSEPIVAQTSAPENNQTDLTIPLMIPKTFTRPLANIPGQSMLSNNTIPLNLPHIAKIKQSSLNTPINEAEKTASVLSSLSEEELIKKAAEMLNEEEVVPKDVKGKRKAEIKNPPPPNIEAPSPKRTKLDVSLPPVPGIDD